MKSSGFNIGGIGRGLAAAIGLATSAMPIASVAAQKFNMKIATATPKGNQNVWMDRF